MGSYFIKDIFLGRRITYFSCTFIWYMIVVLCFSPVFADISYTSGSSKNKTILVEWTLEDSGVNHELKCIAEGNPLPTLKWVRDDDTNFTSSEGIIVDVSKGTEITISFHPITYNISGSSYICVASGSGSLPEYTDFRVFVETPKSTALIIWAVVLLAVFLGTSVLICKTLRINYAAVEMEK